MADTVVDDPVADAMAAAVDFLADLAETIASKANDEQKVARFADEFYRFRQPTRKIVFLEIAEPIVIEQRYLAVADTGGAVYDAAVVLAQSLCRGGPEIGGPVRGKHVVDIGTGTALTAIVAAKLGASSVAPTDGDRTAVELAARNVASNGWPQPNATVSVHRFVWGQYDESPFTRRLRDTPEATDLFLAADLIHDNSMYAVLLEMFGVLLPMRHTTGRLLMCYPTRCAPVEEAFLVSLREQGGFVVTRLDVSPWQTSAMALPVNLICLTRPSPSPA